jgi:hypothetical protein
MRGYLLRGTKKSRMRPSPSFAARTFAAAAIAAATIAATSPPAATHVPPLSLLQRASNPNPTLNSYIAQAHLDAILHALIPIHKTFDGTVYYLRPKRKIELQGVPGPLSQFKDLVTTTPTFEQVMEQYTVTPKTDNGKLSTYSLVPKATGGRVKELIITISDHNAFMRTSQWNYNNGATLVFTQTYMKVGDFQLPRKADINAHFPGYSVQGTLTFSNYQPNATVAPSVFASPSS